MSTIVNTNFQLPTSVISNGLITGNSWKNPNNLLLTDGKVSESNPGAVASDVIVGNFNAANVPNNAVITGIEIELIGAYSGQPTSPPITITPYFVDNTSGANVYYPYVTPQVLTITPTNYVLGSSTYLFATSLTPNQINNAKIGLVANGDVNIDAVKINVFYYIPFVGPGPLPPPSVNCIDCNSPIQAQPFYLKFPFLANDRYAIFQSFNYPDGTPIQYTDLGSCGGSIKFVFDPAVPKVGDSNFEENGVSGVWIILPDSSVQVDFGPIANNRGLMFHTPYTADPALRSNHDANSKVIISDSAPFLGQYLQKCQADFIFSPPIIVENQGVVLPDPVHDFNFQGPGVVVTNDGINTNRKIVTIAGAGGTLPPQIVSTISITSGNIQVTTLTANLQVSGLNRGVVIQVSTEQAQTITGITVGGIAATQEAVSTDAPHNLRQESWFCANPPLGAQAVVVTLSGAAYLTFGAECVNGIDPTAPVGATQNSSGSSFNPILSITTTRDYSIVIDGLATAQTPILYTPGAGQGANWHETANGDTRQGGSSVESAGLTPDAITMDYAITQNTPWVYTAIEIKGITSLAPSADHKVLVSAVDTTPDYLQAKLVAGLNITIVPSGAGNETLTINATGGGGGGTYLVDQSPDDGTYGTLAGAIDGVNMLYTVSAGTYLTGKLTVYLNGLIQHQGLADDFVETVPGSGTFTFNIAPLLGDIITAIYQTANSISQTGIQFDDQTGAPLGAPGTVNEVELTGSVAGVRVGNKVTYTITGGGGGAAAKKVGVGDITDTSFFNAQYLFTTNSTSDQIWTPFGPPQFHGSHVNLGTSHFVKTTNGFCFITDGNYELKFNSNKQIISQFLVQTTPTGATNIGGVGFDILSSGSIVNGQGSNTTAIGFVRNAAGQWFTHVSNGGAFTENAQVISDGAHTFRIEYDPANITPQVRFYLDTVLIDTITTNVPTAVNNYIGFTSGNQGANSALNAMGAPSFSVEQ